jgi:periplasmic divalent cation tolerance protein
MSLPSDCVLSLTTTVGSAEEAERLAQALLARRLAACVQVEAGLGSHYRWQESLHADPEWRLTIKSLPEALPALQVFMAEQHPYEVPQLLWMEMWASPAYAAWVRAEVTLPPGGSAHLEAGA